MQNMDDPGEGKGMPERAKEKGVYVGEGEDGAGEGTTLVQAVELDDGLDLVSPPERFEEEFESALLVPLELVPLEPLSLELAVLELVSLELESEGAEAEGFEFDRASFL